MHYLRSVRGGVLRISQRCLAGANRRCGLKEAFMYWTKRHVVICNSSHCVSRGANDVAGRMRLEVIRRKLDAEILINNCGTIDLCDIGPNIVVYPDNVILSGVGMKDVSRVVDYLAGGEIPADLVLNPKTPAETKRREFYRKSVSVESMDEAAFIDLASQHGFDEGWAAEQARRGFIARKAGAEGIVRISVTSKARTRYGV
jgi:(2Fe-2S) ferredoxin